MSAVAVVRGGFSDLLQSILSQEGAVEVLGPIIMYVMMYSAPDLRACRSGVIMRGRRGMRMGMGRTQVT